MAEAPDVGKAPEIKAPKPAGVRGGARRLGLLGGLLPFGSQRVPAEIIAGATLAALAIPEVLGYAKIAGMPVITGLYTILVPIVVFAILGSSRHLVVGADSATAAIMAAGLASLAATQSPQYVALAGMLAIITGAYLLLARLLRLGFIANFLSRSVLVGFLTGVGIQVACGQFPGLFGLVKSGKEPVQQVANAFKHMGSASLSTLAVSLVVLAVILIGARLAPRMPWALAAVVGAIVVSAAFDLSAHGVATVGAVPRGLPHFAIPTIPAGDWAKLATTAASIFVVVLAQSAATSRAYAAKFDDSFDENVDLVGLGLANITAGLSGTFVVNGSPTKTAMVDKAGGRSQLAQLTTAAIVLAVLLFLTKPLSYLPDAVLAAVVFLIAVELVDLAGLRLLRRRRPVEFWVALLTAATVVLIGVEQGIVLGIVLSIVIHLRHSYRPLDLLMIPARGGDWKAVPLQTGQQLEPGLMAYHFGAGLYYANTGRFADEVRTLVDNAKPPLEWFCLVADAVRDIDFSGSIALRATYDALAQRKVALVLCQVTDPVRAELERDGLIDAIGADRLFETISDVVAAFRTRPVDREHDPRPRAEPGRPGIVGEG